MLGPGRARGGGRAAVGREVQQRGLLDRRRFRDYGEGAAGVVDSGMSPLEHRFEREVKR